MTSIPLNAPWHKEQECMWFSGSYLKGFQDIWTTPWAHDIFSGHKQFVSEVGRFLSFSIIKYGIDRKYAFFDNDIELAKNDL